MILGYENMMLDWLWDKIHEEEVREYRENKEDFEPEFRKDLNDNKSGYYILRHDFSI